MKKLLALILVICLTVCLSGCSFWMDGSYHSIQPHQDDRQETLQETVTATSYRELELALIDMIENGRTNSLIYMPEYSASQIGVFAQRALKNVMQTNPIANYAVEDVTYDMGTANGKPALAVNIAYTRSRNEIRQIRHVANMSVVSELIGQALASCDADMVVRITNYTDTDYALIVQDYAEAYPENCIETPQITAVTYPDQGTDRVLKLTFTYQTNRDALRNMQAYVRPVFEAAELNVRGEETQSDKFSLMYVFLMERSDYQLETSITPAYSLLRHGVGDSKAFAMVYAAMCTRAGLECTMVTGTKEGAPWVWNMICEDGVYYYIDLLGETEDGKLLRLTEEDMQGYVWDYSSFPDAGPEEEATEGI